MGWKDRAEPVSQGGSSWRDRAAPVEEPFKEDKQSYSPGQTALEHGANTAMLGYLPQAQALVDPYVGKVVGALTGTKIPETSYVQERDANISRLAAEEKQNPKSALAGSFIGGTAGAMATPLPELGAAKSVVGGLISGLGHGAAFGAAQGALQNPGDRPGIVDPLQASERKANVKSGAGIGAVTGGAAGLVSSGIRSVANAAQGMKGFAEEQAVKASGAMLKDFRAIEGKDQTKKMGRFALDKKLVQAGDSFDSVATKAEALRKDAGARLDQTYSGMAEKANSPESLNKMTENDFNDIVDSGFNPQRDKKEILSSASEALGDAEGGKAAVQRLSNYLDDIAEKYGNQSLPPAKANEIKGEMDKVINYSRNPLSKEPNAETAFHAARKMISNKIDDSITAMGKLTGDPGALNKLKEANKDYGYASQIRNMAEDRVQRERSNRMFGLTDTIAGGAGSVVGGAAGAATSDRNPIDAGEYGVAGLITGTLANKLGRKYGPGIMSKGADVAGSMAKYSVSPMARGLQAVLPPQQAIGRALLTNKLLNKEKKK